jgi:hypothetical protein
MVGNPEVMARSWYMEAMYNLPRFDETFIAKENGWVFLMWRRGFNGEDG